MTELIFKIPPKVEEVEVGNKNIGVLLLTKYYGLTYEEETFIDELCKEHNLREEWKNAMDLASTIASEMVGCKIIDIANALLASDFDFFQGKLQYLYDYKDQRNSNLKLKQRIIATAIIRYRNNKNKKWSLEDTNNPRKITPQLLNEVIDFAENEQSRWAFTDNSLLDSELAVQQPESELEVLNTTIVQDSHPIVAEDSQPAE